MLKRIFSKITKYAVASTNEAAFITGGDTWETSNTSLVAITSGGLTMLIGGYDSNYTLVLESKPWIYFWNHKYCFGCKEASALGRRHSM